MSMRLSQLLSDIPAMFYFLEEEELPWFLMRNKLVYVQLFNKNFEKVSTGQQLTFLRVFCTLLCFFGI